MENQGLVSHSSNTSHWHTSLRECCRGAAAGRCACARRRRILLALSAAQQLLQQPPLRHHLGLGGGALGIMQCVCFEAGFLPAVLLYRARRALPARSKRWWREQIDTKNQELARPRTCSSGLSGGRLQEHSTGRLSRMAAWGGGEGGGAKGRRGEGSGQQAGGQVSRWHRGGAGWLADSVNGCRPAKSCGPRLATTPQQAPHPGAIRARHASWQYKFVSKAGPAFRTHLAAATAPRPMTQHCRAAAPRWRARRPVWMQQAGWRLVSHRKTASCLAAGRAVHARRGWTVRQLRLRKRARRSAPGRRGCTWHGAWMLKLRFDSLAPPTATQTYTWRPRSMIWKSRRPSEGVTSLKQRTLQLAEPASPLLLLGAAASAGGSRGCCGWGSADTASDIC